MNYTDRYIIGICVIAFSLLIFLFFYTLLTPRKIPDISEICKDYGITCKVKIYNKGLPNAYVTPYDNYIYVHSALLLSFSREELMPVLLHEVGHKVLNHFERRTIEENKYNGKMGINAYCEMRRAHEMEADIWATMVLKQYEIKSTLINFHTRMISEENRDLDYCTHPSINKRLDVIRRL